MTRLDTHLTRHLLPPSLHALLDWEAVCASHRTLRPALILACVLVALIGALGGWVTLYALSAPAPAPIHAVQTRI